MDIILNNDKLKGIQHRFSLVLVISALLQIVIVLFSYGILKKIHNTNLAMQQSKELLLQDYDISEIAKYKLLSNDYGLSVQLFTYQNNCKLDNVQFITSIPKGLNLLHGCLPRKDAPTICESSGDTYYGFIPVEFEHNVLGYVQTKKHYAKNLLDNSINGFVYTTILAIFGVLFINFLLISLSIKKYIRVNLNYLLKFINGGSKLDEFTTREHYEIALALANERENNKVLQEQVTRHEVKEALSDLVRQVTHNIRSPLTTLQMICRNSQDKLNDQDNLQLRSVINDIVEIINGLTLNVGNPSLEDDKNHLPRYINLYSSISIAVENKLTELGYKSCDIQISKESINIENWWVYVAPSTFNSVVSNLLNNAFESLYKSEKLIKIHMHETDNQMIELIIEDNGRGIPESLIGKVKAGLSMKDGGSGIGLSSAWKFVESVGGQLDIFSIVGEGTKVKISLPIQRPSFVIENFEISINKTIIVLDDDSAVHHGWRKFSKQNKVNVIHFSQPELFLDWHVNNGNTNDKLYYIDYYYSNSKMTGIDVLSRLNCSNTVLVTNDYDTLIVQEYCIKNNCYILPKYQLNKQWSSAPSRE